MSYHRVLGSLAGGSLFAAMFTPRAFANHNTDSRVWMSGSKLAIPGGSFSDLDRPTPVKWFESFRSTTLVVTGPNFGAAIVDGGNLFVWGHDGQYFLAPKNVVLAKSRVIDVQCSETEIFVLLENGKVALVDWQTGIVKFFLEIKAPSSFWTSKWTQMSVGDQHAALIDNSGRVWTVGSNEFGQCARTVNRASKKNFQNMKIEDTKDAPKAELDIVYDVPNDKAVSVSCGGRHTLILTESGKLWAFGDDSKIQLGLGDTRSQDSPDYVPHSGMGESTDVDPRKLFKSTIGAVKYSWYEKHFRDRLTPVKLLALKEMFPKKIVTGDNFSLIQFEPSDMIIGCGENQKGQCGRGLNKQQQTFSPVKLPKNMSVIEVQCGASHCVAQLVDGSVWAWGDNKEGQLGTGSRSPACPPVLIHRSKIRGPLTDDIITPIGKSATPVELDSFKEEAHLDQNISHMSAHPELKQPSALKTQLIEAIDSSRSNLMMKETEQTNWEPVKVHASYNNTILILKRKNDSTKP